ncbi:lysophospholipid acyltransferase family protein [Chitinophaga nivalis]|uniref:Lysophospholipid acyltransferase family protein n=1 Tax=Chitinophaga nivalis TaxID=2991709 RepID=A0ABT3IJ22_9BACT|nr:lysophospholipid acyltransferase family protein [Chitinophaga nivalis]MCW3466334.1 lysophospholipid acyltransferase family protein [Chitinophaga nivalis]MCW3483975.1 lysophospholipid acyltransferase family protein [Chitinophaga nivalis]
MILRNHHIMKAGTNLQGLERLIYFFVYKVFRYRYDVVMQNLSRSFPERSYAEIKELTRQFYRHFSHLFLEIIRMFTRPEKQLKRQLKMRNTELLEHYHRQHRNIIIMLGHYGNWECVSLWPRYFSFDIYGVFKPLSNKFAGRIMEKLRTRFGLKLLAQEQASRFMLSNRKKASTYVMISDQSPARKAECLVNFLHQPTHVLTGAERLATALDAVVVYAVINKSGQPGHWEVTFELITDHPTAMAPHNITKKFNQFLENDIRKSPAYWLWTHRRWKTKCLQP